MIEKLKDNREKVRKQKILQTTKPTNTTQRKHSDPQNKQRPYTLKVTINHLQSPWIP